MLKAIIYVSLKSGVLDPQGETVKHALHSLGHAQVEDVRMGKYLSIKIAGRDRRAATAQVEDMCRKLLANPVIENYRFEIQEI